MNINVSNGGDLSISDIQADGTGSLSISTGNAYGTPTINMFGEYPIMNINTDRNKYGDANIFAGPQVADISGDITYAIGFALNSYTPEKMGTLTNMMFAGGNNSSGSNTLFIAEPTKVTFYKDNFVVNGTLQSTAGYAQERLITNQTIPSNSDTLIQFNYSDFDPSGWYNSEYFYFQPTIAGTYQISYSVNWNPAGSGTGQVNVQVHKNTDQISINQQQTNLLDALTMTGIVFVQLNGTTDTLDLTAYSSTGQVINGGNGTYINIKLL